MAPATPEWRVRDILAHMSGVNTDIVNGNLNGVASDAWTDAQVGHAARLGRRARSSTSGRRTAARSRRTPPMLGSAAGQWVYDACTHEHDIRHALGAPGARDSDAVAIAFEWGTDRLGDWPRRPGCARHSCSTPTAAVPRPSAPAKPRAAVRVDRFEVIRAMTGRRSVAQMEAYGWDGPPCPRTSCFVHLHAARRRLRRIGVALPRSLSPFRHRAYARFWFGAFVSNIGTWMETVGVGILVTKQTGQAGWAGLVAAAGVRARARSPGSSAARSPTASPASGSSSP